MLDTKKSLWDSGVLSSPQKEKMFKEIPLLTPASSPTIGVSTSDRTAAYRPSLSVSSFQQCQALFLVGRAQALDALHQLGKTRPHCARRTRLCIQVLSLCADVHSFWGQFGRLGNTSGGSNGPIQVFLARRSSPANGRRLRGTGRNGVSSATWSTRASAAAATR